MLRSLLFCLLLPTALFASDWPTPGHDAARSGRTEDAAPPAPYRVRWAKAWQYENIATVSQLIVAEGRGFIGTLGRDGSLAGKVHCVDLSDGRDLWTYSDLQGGVAHSLTWSPHAGGTVYATTTFGEVIALEAATGKERWKFTTPLGGFVVNPCVDSGAVLVGSRQGIFYALEEKDGSIRWQRDVKLPICHTAAAADGVVYFLDEGIHCHALRIDNGRKVEGWIDRQLHGGSARFYWPVVTKEHVLVTVAPPHQYNWGETDGVLFESPGVTSRKSDRFVIGTAEQEAKEQQHVIEFLKAKPHNQVLHCLARANGRPSCTPGVLYTGGSGSECTPPVLTKDGRIVVEYRSFYSLWDSDSWVNPYSALGTLDPASGVVTQLRPKLAGKALPWGHIWIIADESSSFSIAGDTLLVSHQGNFGGVDLASGQTLAGVGKRDTWGGYEPLSWNRQEWHGGPRSPLTVANNTLYYVTGARVIACEGAAKAGEKNADPVVVEAEEILVLPEFKEKPEMPTVENLTAFFDEEFKRKPPKVDLDKTKALRAALAAHVSDLLETPEHTPYFEWRGISPSTRTMTSNGELMYALALAYPHLEKDLRGRLSGYMTTYPNEKQELNFRLMEPRNYHKIDVDDVGEQKRGLELTRARTDAYTLHRLNEIAVRANMGAVRNSYRRDAKGYGPVDEWVKSEVEPAVQFQRLSAFPQELSNLIGRIQLANAEKRHVDFAKEVERLAYFFKFYLDHYRHIARDCAKHLNALPGDDQHPSAAGQFRNLGGPYVGKTHMAAIVYFTDLCPEAGRLIKHFAPEETAASKAWMLRNAQGFYLARWDTPVQEGEVACPWYVTTQNYFHFFSDIEQSDFATHRLLVDMPVCHADVYYIERLVRAIEASGR